MTIEKTETARLSENEVKAIKLVERICDEISLKASDPDIIEAAYNVSVALANFNDFWDEVV